jgi:hypothetical protein
VTKQISYTVPVDAGCGVVLPLTFNINGSAGARADSEILVLGQPSGATTDENLDGPTAPALPAGWTTATTGGGVAFVTQTGGADSAPNALFTPNTGNATLNNGATVVSSDFAIVSEADVIEFQNKFDTEGGWDGGVLDISIAGGPFVDIIDAGGRFLEGGYNGTIGANNNPLDGRAAWTGDSGGYITTRALIPPAANGQNVKFRWSFGEDNNTFSVGWNIDSISVKNGYVCTIVDNFGAAKFDYDGDGKTDPSIFRPTLGQWWYLRSSDLGNGAFSFGTSTDTMVPADYTGDGKTDIAFWRESTGEWFILKSEDSAFYSFPFGTAGDIPAPGDFDNDGKADPAVFRPSTGTWFILNSGGSGTSFVPFGANGDLPVVDDYDGDGKADVAILRPGVMQWWINRSTTGLAVYQFGSPGDVNVQGDYTGDGKADAAFFRPSTSQWFILRSEDDGFFSAPFGASGDQPVPGDYDGDGTSDLAIFRPSENNWYIQASTNGFSAVQFGTGGDIPTPASYVR